MAVERKTSTLPPAQPSYILRGHASQVHSVQFVCQNARLITGDAEGWVIYWKLETKRALAVWKAHDGAILGTAEWAHDKIITHGRDNSLRIWQIRAADEPTLSTILPAEIASGNRPVPWLLHTLPVNTLNFCAFSMCYASAQTVVKGNGNANDEARPDPDEAQNSILVAVPARDDKKAEVYRFPEERLKYVVPHAQSRDTGMVMAIKLVQIPAAKQTLVVTGYEGGLTAVHVLPVDGSAIGVAQLIYLSQPHTQPILSLDISPDAKTYFTSGADAVVASHRIPELSSNVEGENSTLRAVVDWDDPPVSLPIPDSTNVSDIATCATHEGTADGPAEDPPVCIPEHIPDEPLSFSRRPMAVSPQSEQSNRRPGALSSLLADAQAPLKAASVTPLSSQPTPSVQAPYKINNTKHAGQQSLSVRSDGRLLATGGWDSRVRIYSTKTLKEVAVLKWHKEGVYAVAFAFVLDSNAFRRSSAESEGLMTEEVVIKKTGLSKLQKAREEKMQTKHWVAAGAKDGKVSIWEVF